MKRLSGIAAAVLFAGPALASTKDVFSGEFYTLANTNLIVLIAFGIFVGFLVYLGVPGMLTSQLDKRAHGIRSELDEARALREEAQALLGSFERKQREVKDQAERIIVAARESAAEAAEIAKKDLERSIERRVQAAGEQIAQAEASAVKQVRDEAARIAIAAAGEMIAGNMTASRADALIEDAIKTVADKLH